MPTNSVLFESTDGPEMLTGADASSPNHCFIFRWVVNFGITQGNGLQPGLNKVNGHVVQRVDVSKIVYDCDRKRDDANSEKKSLFETFDIKNGESVNSDTVQLTFLKNRITSLGITLSASFHDNIRDQDFSKKFPGNTNPAGASGLLIKQPVGFSPTLIRSIHLIVDCCNGKTVYSCDAIAHNSWSSYEEEWSLRDDRKKAERKKTVDGKPANTKKEKDK